MKRFALFFICLLPLAGIMAQSREGLSEYKLDNGLTVLLWEDHDAPDVTGYVAVRAGALDEPEEYTGLAHYLEHMLFNGTQHIGALDWEKEKPLYEKIIALYDQYAVTTDQKVRDDLTRQINEASMEEAKISAIDDFYVLMDGIGATDVNAFTSYDMTCYFNSFPANRMLQWLTIFADRLVDPVFRGFQAELENVFEEYNMYEDGMSTQQSNHLMAEVYKGCPYERNVLGKAEHLKNPRLSKLIEFYNTWYVPNNMALIIVGDFDTEKTKPMIAETFGRLQQKPLPERKTYTDTDYKGNPKKTFRIGYYPSVIWAYKGVKVDSEDVLALELVTSLLNNSSRTGLLDKLTMDGVVSGAGVSLDARRNCGRILITAVPYFDVNQQIYESNSATEKIIMAEVDKIKTGNIPDWLIQSVKEEYSQNFDIAFETPDTKMSHLVKSFIYGLPVDDIFTEKERFLALTKEDIERVARKYFDADHLTVQFEKGDPKKNKLAKPQIKPLDPPQNAETEYARQLWQLPSDPVKQTFLDFGDVRTKKIDEQTTLHYTANPKNDIFSLTLRYGVGTHKMPLLEHSVHLMNSAGVLPDTENQQFRRQLSEFGGRLSYGVSESYMTVQIVGREDYLPEICGLMQKQILFPKLDDKQMDNIKGSEFSSRYNIPKMDEVQADALTEYVLYGDKSEYLDLPPFMDVMNANIVQLTTEFVKATEYALDIYYCGRRPMAEVETVLTGNLPLMEKMKPSDSPYLRDRQKYDQMAVYFLPNNRVQQAKVYFYVEGTPYTKDEDVVRSAFNQYFSGGFTGLVMDEIRAKRSMAYTAYGQVQPPSWPDRNSCFIGYIGTQSDKVPEAVKTFMELVNNMPEYPERIEGIRTALRQYGQIQKPSFRNKTFTYEHWQRFGYTDDPARVNRERIDNLTFDQIRDYYKAHVQNKPVTVIIVGDPKFINKKSMAEFGKFNNMSKGRLFKDVMHELMNE
jgi:predicted Zn-dependent peptidase